MRLDEVSGQDHSARLDQPVDDAAAGGDGPRVILAGSGIDLGQQQLDRMVEHIAGEPPVRPGAEQVQGGVAKGVAMRGLDREAGADLEIVGDQFGKARFDDRQHAGRKNAAVFGNGPKDPTSELQHGPDFFSRFRL